jgi:hypothetical protein
VPIIFVHGVNTRHGPAYQAAVLATEKFFRRHLTGATVDGKTLADGFKIEFPNWGDLATTFAWSGAALPRAEMQALGGPVDADFQPLIAHLRDALGTQAGSEPLTALAKRDFSQAVDLLSEIALQGARPGEDDATADFVVQALPMRQQTQYRRGWPALCRTCSWSPVCKQRSPVRLASGRKAAGWAVHTNQKTTKRPLRPLPYYGFR